MDWQPLLEKDENLLWEAKPAPRCYTFRNWRRTILGLLLLTLAVYWEMAGLGMTSGFGPQFLGWLLLPLLGAGVWFSAGHMLVARREWENVFYAASDRRLLLRCGLLRPRQQQLLLAGLSGYRVHAYGLHLADVQVFTGDAKTSLTFHCIEHPEKLTELLEKSLAERDPPVVVPV
ncbi:hypothetical protein [Geoalkalibacter halelectricus]|uniref:DUF304 domain-containing protein n=1 Tax=Geoalkalibacter halelectricus TaxID=2847045 RepID=A0ABY5ZHE0_9BACT|nr:hypothetical protein [Geoalkalibacter halelectricus]MDO3379616.1 hypothetical protein [Geoalkalibacter halelectricus]UWZ78568.1 hypothetical protein L9S41_12875 [Geoalkalibacter halelectricus]